MDEEIPQELKDLHSARTILKSDLIMRRQGFILSARQLARTTGTDLEAQERAEKLTAAQAMATTLTEVIDSLSGPVTVPGKIRVIEAEPDPDSVLHLVRCLAGAAAAAEYRGQNRAEVPIPTIRLAAQILVSYLEAAGREKHCRRARILLQVADDLGIQERAIQLDI